MYSNLCIRSLNLYPGTDTAAFSNDRPVYYCIFLHYGSRQDTKTAVTSTSKSGMVKKLPKACTFTEVSPT